MRLKKVEVYGLKFNSMQELLTTLGYNSKISFNQVIKRFGSVEAFIKQRLHTETDDQTAETLRSLLLQVKGARAQSTQDRTLLKLECMALDRFLFSTDIDRIIESVAQLYADQRSVEEIKQLLLARSTQQ